MAGTAVPERVVAGERISVETEYNFQILIDFGDAFFVSITTGFSMQLYRSPAIELCGGEGTLQMMAPISRRPRRCSPPIRKRTS